MHGLALALLWAAIFGHLERNPAEVERSESELIELSTRQNFPYWIVSRIHNCAVERSAILAIQLRASRGSRTEYEPSGQLDYGDAILSCAKS
jgi:hypothetical protein